jgi:hypothetical protein
MTSKKAARKKVKQQRRVVAAECRIAPKSLEVASMLNYIPSPRHELTAKTRLSVTDEFERFEAIFLTHSTTKWDKWLSELYEHHNAANNAHSEYTVVDRLATKLIDDVSKLDVELLANPLTPEEGHHQRPKVPQFSCWHQVIARQLRSFARMKLLNPEGSIEDATEGLAIARIIVMQTKGDNHPPSREEIEMLITRGMCLLSLKDFEGAYQDLQAAMAAFDTKTEEWFGWPTRPGIVFHLLSAMAGRKDGCARPHYKEEQIESVQKELGLRLYQRDNSVNSRNPFAMVGKVYKSCQQAVVIVIGVLQNFFFDQKWPLCSLLPVEMTSFQHKYIRLITEI